MKKPRRAGLVGLGGAPLLLERQLGQRLDQPLDILGRHSPRGRHGQTGRCLGHRLRSISVLPTMTRALRLITWSRTRERESCGNGDIKSQRG